MYIPDFIREDMLLNDEELKQDVLAFTDWRTKDLFTHAGYMNQVVFPVNRMVCDPERFRSDEMEAMSRIGIGVVYEKDAFLRPLRKRDAMKRELMLRLYYDPHHRKLAETVERAIRISGECLLVDAHSFPGTPLPYEPDQNADRPDICIGTCTSHTPKPLLLRAVRYFEGLGLSVAVNFPYSGTMVPMQYMGDPRVRSIMVEVNRDLYRKCEALHPSNGYAMVKNAMKGFLDCIVA